MTTARREDEKARRSLASARRREVKEKLATLRRELRDARARRKLALLDARERCRAERLATREKNRAVRLRVLGELRTAAGAERALARQACTDRVREARAIGSDSARERAMLVAEKKLNADIRRVEIADRKRRRETPPAAGLERQAESDDEVRATLPSELWPLFDRVRRSIKAGPRGISRAEVFLKYAEAHPDEVLVTSCDASDTRVCELERQERELAKEIGRTPNSYEAKKAARIERMRERAARLAAEAASKHAAAKRISDMIPLGQPILVGHHSEGRHRRDLGRIQDGFSKSFELLKESESLARRAERAESSGAISSDDPDAIRKLVMKLEQLERDRTRMLAVNKAVRSNAPRDALAALGYEGEIIDKFLTGDELGRKGIPSYALQNTAQEAARLRKRIQELTARKAAPAPPAVQGSGVRVEEADNRVRIIFDAKPAEAIRTALKSAGFRWAPSVGAWQRQASNAAWYEAKRITGVGIGPPVKVEHGRPSNQNAVAGGGPRIDEEVRMRRLAAAQAARPAVKDPMLNTTEVAAKVRADIKAAVKRGTLPRAKYSVQTDYYSMGSSITVKATQLPFPVLDADAFIVRPGNSYISFDSEHHRSRFTREAADVDRQLNAIVDAYHWDRSDLQSDYHNQRFARDVEVVEDRERWRHVEAVKVAEARAAARKE
jgi:hypothetical protein